MKPVDYVMNLVRFLILFLILGNIPSYLKAYFGGNLGPIASYASSMLLLFYFVFTKEKHKPLLPFVLLGILYFLLGSFNYTGGLALDFIKEFVRFMIVVVCAVEVLYRTNKNELYTILFIGSLSVIVNATIFPLANANFSPTYGRYSGFYLNPNFAGAICLIGFALSYSIKQKWFRIAGQLTFTLAGILTFSRGFIVIWLLIIVISIYNNRKNLVVPMIGVGVLIVLFALSSLLSLNKQRFNALQSIFEIDTQVQTGTITEDSRTATWALYTAMIAEKPFFGNGFKKLREKSVGLPGAHNSYLLVLGESGFIPFLLMLGIYGYLIVFSFRSFKSRPEYFYLSCVLSLSLMVGHGYFDDFYNVMISMFVYVKLRQLRSNKRDMISVTALKR